MNNEQAKAETIRKQLGGNRFDAMTGAKNYGYSEGGNRLSFKIGKNPGRVTHVSVILNEATDLYRMEFVNWRGTQCKLIAERDNVYGDKLQEVFTEVTKLDTHL